MVTCEMCARSEKSDARYVCMYDLKCVACAARLIDFVGDFDAGKSAMLEAVKRIPGTPSKKMILSELENRSKND